MALRWKSRPSADGRSDEPHHHFRIVAGRIGGTCRAIACLDKRRLDGIEAETVEEAVEAMKRSLDDHQAALRRERRGESPTEREYREVLTVLEAELPASLFTLLDAHARHADASAAVGDLAAAKREYAWS